MKLLKSFIIFGFLSLVLSISYESAIRQTPVDSSLKLDNKLQNNSTILKRSPNQNKYLYKRATVGIKHVYRLQVYEGSNKLIEGDFDIKTVSHLNPKNDKGLYLSYVSSYDPNNPISKEILVKDGDRFFIPYRVLSTEFEFTDPWLSNKYFHTIFKRTNTQTFDLYIYFPYNFWSSDEISNADALQIKDWLNSAYHSKLTFLLNVKTNINQAASDLVAKHELMTDILSKDFNVDNSIAKLKTKMSDIQKQMNEKVSNLQGYNDKIQQLEIQTANLKHTADQIKSELNQLGEQNISLKNELDELESTNDNIEVKKKEIDKGIKSDTEKLVKESNILAAEAPQAAAIVETAKTNLLKTFNLKNSQEQYKEVLP